MDNPGYEADKLHISLYELNSKKIINLTGKTDISFKGITWEPTSKYIIGDADYLGFHSVFSILVSNGNVTEIIHQQSNSKILFSNKNGHLLRNGAVNPTDIWSFKFVENGSAVNLTQLTYENKETLKNIDLIKPLIYYFYGDNNDVVQLWFLNPIGLNTSKKWPLVHLIHGGPQGYFGDQWSYRWNPQLWASHGYAVAMVNFHGSTGYGQNFTNSVSGNWGGHGFIDIMNATDFLLKKFKWLDADRISACGASYGGYMINWILGNTNRFKCLVCHDGLFDTQNFFFSTDELWFAEWEFKGTPWTKGNVYEKWNPANRVKYFETPTLVVHGGRDYRVDLSQGIGLFTALQRLNIKSEFLYFPLENHFVSNPKNSIKWYNTVLGWLDQFNKNQTDINKRVKE